MYQLFISNRVLQEIDKIDIKTVVLEKPTASQADKLLPAAHLATLRSWLLCWEIYLILLVAAFLRLYQLNTTEFDSDQANFFQMARYAVTHGFIPATANTASVGPYIPPATIDIFMIPAALTKDPLWGAITVGILATVSVLLTYGFVRLYYGRVAATIAALLYATLFRAVVYSRFIWNINLLPLFIVLFFMALFWGVVARRKGWLFPALFLLGILIQLHATAAILISPVVIALVLAPGTMRWRDLTLGLLSLLIIYLPYLLWEIKTHFQDIHILMQIFLHPQQKVVFDDMAWLFYQAFLDPYNVLSKQNPLHWLNVAPYLDETSVLWKLAPYLAWISQILIYLVIASVAAVLVLAAWPWGSSSRTQTRTAWGYVRHYWLLLRTSPYRCGLIVLLSWQIVPLAILLRHSLPLFLHYFIFLIPGPCILVGIFLAKMADAVLIGNRRVPTDGDIAPSPILCALQNDKTITITITIPRHILCYGIYALASLIIIAQFISSTVGIIDIDHGNYSDAFGKAYVYDDLRSLHAALTEADQLAQRLHLNRVYISVTGPVPIRSSLDYLSTQMRTPTTVLDSNCIVLPSTAEGPALMLVKPYSDFINALVTSKNFNQYSTATLIGKPSRPGGAPFSLYLVTPKPTHAISHAPSLYQFRHELQLDPFSQSFLFNHTPWLVTHWSLLRSALPSYNKTYTYSITMTHYSNRTEHKSTTTQCTFRAMRAGDQVLIPFNQGSLFTDSQRSTFSAVDLNGLFYETNPIYLDYSPFTFLTFATTTTPTQTLYTPKHNVYLTADVHILLSPSSEPAKKSQGPMPPKPSSKPAKK
ncbi:MAG TPA: glycosyltransferase family 39 protein [Ktedonobacteraceae bacterium]|nr:glycosyltransferase family 39 protein [Ktedonobacteraceae bacterium]